MKAEKGLRMLLMKFTNKEFLRFVISGGVNTVFTYILYLIFISKLNYALAYAISFVCGIILSYLMNSLFVFREKLSMSKMLKFPVVYIVQFGISEFFLYLVIKPFQLNQQFAPLVVLIVTVPITFILSRFIIKNNTTQKSEG
jgi:putative flippase GtrA